MPFFTRSWDWTIKDEQCQRIGGVVYGCEVRIFTVSLNGANMYLRRATVQHHVMNEDDQSHQRCSSTAPETINEPGPYQQTDTQTA